MTANSDITYCFHTEITLPASTIYSFNYVMNKIIDAHKCMHGNYFAELDLALIGMPANYPLPNRAICNACDYDKKLYRFQLMKRLQKAVKNNELEVWGGSRRNQVSIPPDTDDKYLSEWAIMAELYKDDLVKFCRKERVKVVFEKSPEEARIAEEARIVEKNLGSYATYYELANAFCVKNDKAKNLTYFKDKCSSTNRYSGFKEARRVAGKRGGGGHAAKFDVLQVAAILEEKKQLNKEALRRAVHKNFPLLADEFDDRF